MGSGSGSGSGSEVVMKVVMILLVAIITLPCCADRLWRYVEAIHYLPRRCFQDQFISDFMVHGVVDFAGHDWVAPRKGSGTRI